MKVTEAVSICITITSTLVAQSNWKLEDDSANFAFIVIDYETYGFDGGYFDIFEPCDTCSGYEIPFKITFNSPADYGNIMFQYDVTNDTILFADIWWMGKGEIVVPNELIPADSFKVEETAASNPVDFEYYRYMAEVIPEEEYYSKADSAWDAVNNLDIVNSYAEAPYIAGLYLYTPSVGAFDPAVAKWIIFLYRDDNITSIPRNNVPEKSFQLYQNYPNPFNPATTIEFYLQKPSQVRVVLYDVLGREIKTLIAGFKNAGRHKLDFNAEGLSSGIYYYKITTGNQSETKKLVLLK